MAYGSLSQGMPSSFSISFFDMKKAKRNFDPYDKYVVGYGRLSFDEDGDGYCSIENQAAILEDVYHNRFENPNSSYTFIADDNVSGYKFDREGLFRLLRMIEDGKCNIIIAKDLSRIGRHSALTQLFIEQCQKVGIHIHAMEDYDTGNESDDMILGIKAWSNERVVKDTSAKIKKVIKHKQTNGTWFCAAPFGYEVLDYEKGLVRVDPEAAATIKRIFKMFINGNGINKIAKILTAEGVPTPNMVKQKTFIANGREYKGVISKEWLGTRVATVLDTEFYTGTLVTGRWARDGINGVDCRTDKSKWTKFENHHEAIIDKETFEEAQRIRQERLKTNYRTKKGVEHLFHGLLFCAECGSVLYHYSRHDLSPQYVCSRNFKLGNQACTRHKVRESMLITVVTDYLKIVRDSCADIISSMDKEISTDTRAVDTHHTIRKLESDIASLEQEISVIEEQRIKQIIAHPEREDILNKTYDAMIEKDNSKLETLKQHIDALRIDEHNIAESKKKARKAIDIINNVIESQIIDRRAITALIDKIIVHENGDIDVQLKPYLEALNAPKYTITETPCKHPAETHNISQKTGESGTNEVREGDPSHTLFAQRISVLYGIYRLTSDMSRYAGI